MTDFTEKDIRMYRWKMYWPPSYI